MEARLILGDCLDIVPTLQPQSVDAIITDIPYGTTACKWDSIIPFDDLWRIVKHILKPNGAFVTTASQPFTSALVMSNPKWYKTSWIWEKERPSNFFQAKYAPLNSYEDILVFSKAGVNFGTKTPIKYNPQGTNKINVIRGNSNTGGAVGINKGCQSLNGKKYLAKTENYPKRLLKFSTGKTVHPTQKPVALYEYLIKTYTNEGDTVLDITMGSGTTGVACKNTNRNFIGIEKEPEYFEIARKRIYD